MKRSKKIFLIASLVFFLMIVLIGIDIARKTSFPGSRKHWKEYVAPSDTTTKAKEEQEAK